MCPSCRAFVNQGAGTCPYCGERLGQRAIDQREPGEILGGLIPQAHFTTILILMINVGLFIATKYFSSFSGESPALLYFGGKYGRSIWLDHEYWRLVTAGFLHGGILHIAMNSWVLYDLGAQVEQVFGTARFLVIYFTGTVAGFYLSAQMNPGLSIGSSAGIMGLIGAMIAFGVVNRTSVGSAIRSFYIRWAIYGMALGLILNGIDNWAHLGGIGGGFAIAYLAGTPVRSSRSRDSVWRVIAFGCVIITAYCFYEVFRHFPTAEQLR